jgi:hypothetical protein
MKRTNVLYCFVLSMAVASGAHGEVTYSKIQQGNNEVEVVRMTVTPAAEPVPALRYRLIPHDVDLKSGNAAPFYYRAQLDLRQRMKVIREKFNEDKELSLWYGTGAGATPIRDLPLDKVRKANEMFDPIFNDYLKPAFERSGCDWELGVEELRGPDIVNFLLPEFQESREISRMLALRTRLAIAEHRYDDAVETMRQQYRLGRDAANVPFIVCGLIGIAIDGITNGTLIDLLASPDSPNLYWALSQLPNPPVDLRPAARFELDFGPRMFPFIHKAETTERSPQEWNRLFGYALLDLKTGMGSPAKFAAARSKEDDVVAGVAATGVGLLGYSHAKQQLIASGMDRNQVEKMAVGQVIAIYTERNYRRFADDWEKLWCLPFPEMNKASESLERRLDTANILGGGKEREIIPLVSWLMPAMQAARSAQVRLEREVAALRIIEALRMYAAGHDGQFPAHVEDIKEVPVPANPATLKPFLYRLEGATAILELPPSDRLPGGNRRYEIQIASKK